uniref:Seipin n=1 Tax=Mesocestoides corti TaxID=53468 RepID=A0A5K3F1L7_MESCO
MTPVSSSTHRGLISGVFGKLSYFVGLQILFLLWASVVFFIICKVYVPNVGSVHEIHLSFESSGKHGRIFSTNVFPLSDRGSSFFTASQEYKLVVHMSVPDSPHNHDVDMSSLRLNLYSMHGNHSTTLSNTLLPIYRPWLIDTADTLLYAPLYLLRLWKKEQTLTTVLSSDYVDNQVVLGPQCEFWRDCLTPAIRLYRLWQLAACQQAPTNFSYFLNFI